MTGMAPASYSTYHLHAPLDHIPPLLPRCTLRLHTPPPTVHGAPSASNSHSSAHSAHRGLARRHCSTSGCSSVSPCTTSVIDFQLRLRLRTPNLLGKPRIQLLEFPKRQRYCMPVVSSNPNSGTLREEGGGFFRASLCQVCARARIEYDSASEGAHTWRDCRFVSHTG